MKTNNLFIIDGHALAYRAHYALITQHLQDKDGNPTETLFGFFRMLAKLLLDRQPHSLLIVFDPPEKNFRHRMYQDYKANRKKTPDELRVQIEQIQKLLKKLGFAVLLPQDAEADDLMASIVKQKQEQYQKFLLVSGDKDLFALLSDKVQLLRGQKGFSEFTVIDEEYLQNKYSITANMVADFMAITGDSADNVPGVKGIGEKGATKLLQEYQTLENIYQHLEEIKPAGVQKKLTESKEMAFLSQKLVTLKNDLSFEFSDEDVLFHNILEKLSANLHLLQTFSLHSVMREWQKLLKKNKIEMHQPSPQKKNETMQNSSYQKVEVDFTIVKDKSQWNEFEKQLNLCSEISVDTETTSPHPMQAQLVGVSISYKKEQRIKSIYLPVRMVDSQEEFSLHSDYQELPRGEEILKWIKPLLENSKINKIGQNIKYDLLVLQQHGIELQGISFDTMLASYLVHVTDMRHNLDNLALYYFQHKNIAYKDLVGSGKNEIAITLVELDKLAAYACEDSHITLMLKDELLPLIEKNHLNELFENIDMPLLLVLAEMEKNGIEVNRNYLKKLDKQFLKELSQLEQEIYQLAGEEFNINSPKELREILYQKMGIRTLRKTGGGEFSTDAKVLQWLKNEHEIVQKILDYRTVKKLSSTYAIPLQEAILPNSGRVHSSFSQITTATGRLSSFDPNLQNIPVKEESGKAIRRAFEASKNHSFVSLDYSQIELRILAHYSQDPALCNAFANDNDVHDLAALLLFYEQIFPEKSFALTQAPFFEEKDFLKDSQSMIELHKHPQYQKFRTQAKVMNFSIAYGVTDFGLSQNLGISRKEAAALIDIYFTRFAKIRNYMDSQIEQARQTLTSENFFGRKRSLRNINATRRPDRLAAERLAINNPIQSTAADIIKLAMIEINKLLKKKKLKSRLLLQIHDELLFESPDQEVEELQILTKKSMEHIVSLQVPLKVNIAAGKTWDAAK